MAIQISISNAIGSRSRGSVVPPIDPDAQAFITAASITDPTQQAAINTLVVDLKGYNIWTKMKALYPFVGGTASTHKWNLKDPRDLDAAFRIFWNGDVTHSSNGVQFGGVNGWGNTYLIAQGTLGLNSTHVSIYSRTNTDLLAPSIGNITGGASAEVSMFLRTGGVTALRVNNGTASTTATTDSRGLFIGNRNSSTQINLSIRGTQTTFNQNSNSLSTNVMQLGGVNPNFFDTKQLAFASIGDGLTAQNMTDLTTAVQAFQTTLGRSIGTQTVSDADAQAFVTNAGIVDQVEANAINNLVIGLKADGLWTKMKAVYPMVGGSNTSNSYNLRNTAQYQISWGGSVTSNSNGVTFGANGYGNTNLNPNTAFSTNDSMHLSAYSRTNNDLGGLDFGGLNASAVSGLYLRYSNNAYAYINGGAGVLTANTNSTGFYVGTRTASNVLKLFKNTAQLGSTYTAANGARLDLNAFLGAVNATNLPSYYTQRNYAFASIGDGLTDTEAANFYTAVQTFQTTLGRQVGTPIPLTGTLLNDYPDAAAAYSLRKLRTAYTGNCIRVRRSSDNTELNIGFVSNVLDTASLITFVGSGDGFVTTWYDQSGNSNNANQSTAGLQPAIVESGILLTVNSKPNIKFYDAFSHNLRLTSTIVTGISSYNSFVGKRAASGKALLGLAGDVSSSVQYLFTLFADNNYYLQAKTTQYQVSTATDTTTNQLLLTGLNNAGTMSIFKNGNTITSSALSASYTPSINNIGKYTTASTNNALQEIVFYNSEQSSNRTGIESNINSFYSIY